ncbi:ABC-type multidrug transport system ATPase subunit [Aeribacillus composti]|uniref:ABC transporter ATP-binding protein n=1 Tax=Aeribacillus composti TaxID=1868734 RepID=UPI00119A2DD2|nr:ABC transporter ATP-binding protein [Aeribacillus composti]TVZ84635.1 ABC-type multidrug transport system ATPase subunit [Aeribacillus composti]
MTTLQVSDVSKKYKTKVVLSSMSLEAKKGECIVLCGGNGAGKSTLLRILAGISKPSSGDIVLNNISLIKNRKNYIEQIGYMPDDFHAQQFMTLQEFLSFYAKLRKKDQSSVKDILKKIGLEEFKRELVKNVSKGMRQRLLLGQALLGNPKLLLLDEPTNGLDPFWIDQFVNLIKEQKMKGTIIIFSTHMMDVAAEAGDQILFIKEGSIIDHMKNTIHKEKTALQLLRLYRHEL